VRPDALFWSHEARNSLSSLSVGAKHAVERNEIRTILRNFFPVVLLVFWGIWRRVDSCVEVLQRSLWTASSSLSAKHDQLSALADWELERVTERTCSFCCCICKFLKVRVFTAYPIVRSEQAAAMVDLYSGGVWFEFRPENRIFCFRNFPQSISTNGSRDSSVGIATGYGLDDRGVGVQVPLGLRIISSVTRPARLWGPPSLLSNGTPIRGLFPRS
jgi:hypothetical protein